MRHNLHTSAASSHIFYLYTSQHATYELQLKPAQNQIPQMKYHNYVSFKASKYFKMEHQKYTSHSSNVCPATVSPLQPKATVLKSLL